MFEICWMWGYVGPCAQSSEKDFIVYIVVDNIIRCAQIWREWSLDLLVDVCEPYDHRQYQARVRYSLK